VAAAPLALDGQPVEVLIDSFSYMPQQVTVPVGASVRWTNRDSSRHTVTSGLADAPDGLFDSAVMEQGDTFEWRAVEEGTYAYFCNLHPRMTGQIQVVP
jgi:plastocyanin